MLTATDIHNIKFSKSMAGYKQEEVDVFLDKIEADYRTNERIYKEFQNKIENLNKEIEELKASKESIQNVLLSAQNLADSIVNEAKVKSEEIIRNAESNIETISAREKELSATFEVKAEERKTALEAELEDMVKTAKIKADAITLAAKDSVSRQQILFDKLKMEIAAFKTNITSKYKEHLEILSTIPDTVPTDPTRIAEIVSAVIDETPDAREFIAEEKNDVQEEIIDDIISKPAGFKVESEEDDF